MKKFKTIKEMRQDQDLMNLIYGEYAKVLIDGKEYIVGAIDGTYNDIIEDFFYKALESINKEFEINELPVPKRYSLKDAMFETCVALRDKMLEGYAEAGINFINVREEQDDGIIYENLEDGNTEISGITTGTKLTIEGQEYIVIENVQGNQYKVLSSDAVWKRFDDNRSNNYATSTIADYLDNDYYNNLPEIIKNAVVKTPIQQTELNTYAFINPTNWGEKTDAGTHKVFIPSWDEVTKVYGTSHYKLKAYAPDSWTWLRDIYSNDVLIVDRNGILDNNVPHINLYVRPAMVLDLSKVKFNNDTNKERGKKMNAIELKIEGGLLRATVNDDQEYPGIDIEFIPDDIKLRLDGGKRRSYPRVLMEKPQGESLRVLVWNDKNSEDYTDEIEINEKS